MSDDRPYCFVTLFVGLRRGDWLCGVEDLVDLIIYVYWACSWSVEASGLSLVDLLHSFRSFASLLICLIPALDIWGLGCVVVVVSGRCVYCMGHI